MATNQDASTLLQEGIAATRRGDKTAAYDLLKQVIELDERNEQAWLWLSGVVDSREDMQACLKNVLQINPNNARAAAGLRWLQQQQMATAASGNQFTPAAPNSSSLSATFPCPNCGKLVAENSLSCPDCAFQFYARCPNCAEYVDTAAVPDPRGDHCPNCGTAINRMELGRAASAIPLPSDSSSPHSIAAGEEITPLPLRDLVEPMDKPRRSRGRLIYQLLLLLVLLAFVIFLLWAKANLK